jgi:hypothetical protein
MDAVVEVQYQPLSTLMNGCLPRQGRQFGLQTEQAAQFAAIGHAPITLAELLFEIHGRDEIQCLLPGEGKFREIGIATPDQAR